jgi:hypothetical protein
VPKGGGGQGTKEEAKEELTRTIDQSSPSQRVLEAHRSELVACLSADTPKATLVVTVNASGSPKVEILGKASKAVSVCLTSTVGKLTFAKTPASATLELAR